MDWTRSGSQVASSLWGQTGCGSASHCVDYDPTDPETVHVRFRRIVDNIESLRETVDAFSRLSPPRQQHILDLLGRDCAGRLLSPAPVMLSNCPFDWNRLGSKDMYHA